MIDRDSQAPNGGEKRRRPWRVVVPAAALAVAVSIFGINAITDNDNSPKSEQGEAATPKEKAQETAVDLTKDINQLFEQIEPQGSPDTTSVDGQASITFSVQGNESKGGGLGYSFGAFVDKTEDGQPDWDNPQKVSVSIYDLGSDLPTIDTSYTFERGEGGNWTINVLTPDENKSYTTDKFSTDVASQPLDTDTIEAVQTEASKILVDVRLAMAV